MLPHPAYLASRSRGRRCPRRASALDGHGGCQARARATALARLLALLALFGQQKAEEVAGLVARERPPGGVTLLGRRREVVQAVAGVGGRHKAANGVASVREDGEDRSNARRGVAASVLGLSRRLGLSQSLTRALETRIQGLITGGDINFVPASRTKVGVVGAFTGE